MRSQLTIRVKAADLRRKLGLKDGKDAVVDYAFIEKRMRELMPLPTLPVDGKNGKDGRDAVDGKDGSPDTPDQVRDKLEALKGNERLGIEAIDGLSDSLNEFDRRTTKRITGGGLSPGALSYFFKENIVPTGTINGSNKTFTLPDTPASGTLRVFADGVRQQVTTDYTLSGTTITFIVAPTTSILCDYRV